MKRPLRPMTAERVQAIRDALQLTQQELADLVGSDVRTVQRWLYGERTPRGPAHILLEELEWKAKAKRHPAERK